MKRFLSITCSIIVLLIIVGAIAIGSLLYFVDPNKMRPVIVEEVMNRTGYQLAIYGKLDWRIFPTVGIRVQRMTLTSPDQLEPFIDLRNVTVASRLSQFLYGKKLLKGDITVENLKFMNMSAHNTRAHLSWKDSVLTIAPFKASLYGGSLQGTAHGSNLNERPKWDWKFALNNVALQPLLKDASKGEAKLNVSGIGNLEITGEGTGTTGDQVIASLNGDTKFSVREGSVQGINLNHLMQVAQALINKSQVEPTPEGQSETLFNSFTGDIVIKNGVASTDSLLLTAPAFTMKGVGEMNLLHQAVNFALQVKPTQESKIKWEVPVLVTGSVKHPDIQLDLGEVQRMIAQQQIEKVKEKVNEEITKRIPGKAGEALQNLLGN